MYILVPKAAYWKETDVVRIRYACYIESRIGWIFRMTWKHLQHDAYALKCIAKIVAIKHTRKFALLVINITLYYIIFLLDTILFFPN